MGSFQENQTILVIPNPSEKSGSPGYGDVMMYKDASSKAKFVSKENPLPVSGGSAAGGSGIVVGSEIGSYIFDASAQTITFAGLPNLKIEEIQQITNVTDGIVIYSPSSSASGGSISSNILTLEYDTTSMSDTDSLQIYLQYNNSEDYTTGTKLSTVNNPEWAHYTSAEHLVDEVDLAADTYRVIINQEGYRNAVLQLKGSGGVTFTVWASLDDTADDSADTGWVDVSSTVMGVASLVDSEGIYFVDTNMMPDRFMIKYVTSDVTNAVDVWFKRY